MSEPRYRAINRSKLDQIPQLARLPEETRRAVEVVSLALPFRVNQYVLEELIDWGAVPDDPVFQLVFPQPETLSAPQYAALAGLLERDAPSDERRAVIAGVRAELNPHPADQISLNVPRGRDGAALQGLQHKYRETVLVFPAQGQTCHAYCSFCFRWAQFIGDTELRFAARHPAEVARYVEDHREITDVLLTGGDPMVMRTAALRRYVEPLLAIAHVRSIRIGTKALTFWPGRFVTDPDADELTRLFEQVVAAGKHLAVMAHLNHWREVEAPMCQRALVRIRATGALVRGQAPLLRHVNDDPSVWRRLWVSQVRAGVVPYYMFVARDTGARRYFEVPLGEAHDIFREAVSSVSGLARTVRGPSMSASPGKVEIQGTATVAGERVFVLRFVQARDPAWVGRPFFARYDRSATWLDELRPAFGKPHFFFEAKRAPAPEHAPS